MSFAYDNQTDRNKLDPKALKCVFLGYSKTQKGYKCYYPSLNKFMTSVDVTFFEFKSYLESEFSIIVR